MNKINVIGCGPGSIEYILPPAIEKIKTADVLVGSQKTLEIVDKIKAAPEEKIIIDKNLENAIDYINQNREKKNIAVLLTGDPGFYSLFNLLKNKFPREAFTIIPGLSSLQLAFAKLNDIWHDAKILSLHGREENFNKLYYYLKKGQKTAVLLGNMTTHELKEKLLNNGIQGERKLAICAELSLPGETIIETDLNSLKEHPEKKDCLVIFKEENLNTYDHYNPSMIKDEEFIRGNIPMTKEEIRTIIIAKLKLFPGAILWDIGAGTGSISIQAAMHLDNEGKVYAIDHKKEAVNLIEQNVKKFACLQVEPKLGKAPEVLKELPLPHRVIIGGSDKEIREILKLLDNNKEFKGPVVIPTIALETFENAYNYFRNKSHWNIDVTKLQVNNLERHGSLSLWKSKNPVSIITAEKS